MYEVYTNYGKHDLVSRHWCDVNQKNRVEEDIRVQSKQVMEKLMRIEYLTGLN